MRHSWLVLIALMVVSATAQTPKVKPIHMSWFNHDVCAGKMPERKVPCTQSIEIWDTTLDKQIIILKAEVTTDNKPQKWVGGDQTHNYKARSLGFDEENFPSQSPWIIALKTYAKK